jgi:hypothetical protein
LAPASSSGGQVISLLEVDRVDVFERDEVLDLDGPGLPGRHPLQLLGGDDDELALVHFVALDDVLVVDLPPGVLRDPLVPDPLLGPLLELVEPDVLLLGGRVQLHRHGHQPEADRPAPDRTSHDRIFPRCAGSNA